MKNIILATVSTLALGSAAFAGGATIEATVEPTVEYVMPTPAVVVTGSVGIDFTKNSADNIVGDSVVELGVTSGLGFASVELLEDGGSVTLDKYSMGTRLGSFDVSIGKQGDVLGAFGGVTETVGGTTLADPSDDHETIHVGTGGYIASIGFTDISSDVTDIENIQLVHGRHFNGMTVIGGIDYNLDTEDFTLLSAADFTVSGYAVGVTTTYADHLAYEFDVDAFGVTSFMNGDEDDLLQNVGVTYNNEIVGTGLSYYAEAAYNIDDKELTPAAGLSFNF